MSDTQPTRSAQSSKPSAPDLRRSWPTPSGSTLRDAYARGLERDGRGARADWERWVAGEDRYIEREWPRERADVVVAVV